MDFGKVAARFQTTMMPEPEDLKSGAEVAADIAGWMYVVIWMTCVWPQIWLNFKRQSVSGLSLDYVAFSATGCVMYLIFNLSMYFDPETRREYIQRFYSMEGGKVTVPVYLNDVAFAIMVCLGAVVLVYQSLTYDRGNSNISWIGTLVVLLSWTVMVVLLPLSWEGVVAHIDYIYSFSYIKLFYTITMYLPQIYQNWKSKSTAGFAITFAIMDMSGGLLMITQMIILAIDHKDPAQITGNLAKFGIGLVTLVFDIILIVQAYMYNKPNEIEYEQGELEEKVRALREEEQKINDRMRLMRLEQSEMYRVLQELRILTDKRRQDLAAIREEEEAARTALEEANRRLEQAKKLEELARLRAEQERIREALALERQRKDLEMEQDLIRRQEDLESREKELKLLENRAQRMIEEGVLDILDIEKAYMPDSGFKHPGLSDFAKELLAEGKEAKEAAKKSKPVKTAKSGRKTKSAKEKKSTKKSDKKDR